MFLFGRHSCLVVMIMIGFSTSAKLPKTWKTCKPDSEMNHCLESAIGEAIKSMKSGMPSVGVTPLEPLHFDKLVVDQSTGPVAIKLEFTNLDISGLADGEINHVQSDLMKGHLHFHHSAKKPIVLRGDYTIKGKVLILPIQGDGKATIVFDGPHMECDLKGKVTEKKHDKYLQVDKFETKLSPDHVTMNFTNLFNGNKELGDNMNKFLNENWEEIMKELGPAIGGSISAGFKELANRVFQRVPLSQIVKN